MEKAPRVLCNLVPVNKSQTRLSGGASIVLPEIQPGDLRSVKLVLLSKSRTRPSYSAPIVFQIQPTDPASGLVCEPHACERRGINSQMGNERQNKDRKSVV